MDISDAIRNGDSIAVKQLIDGGLAIDSELLIDAVMGSGASRLSIVNCLLNAGAAPNYSNGCTTPLEVACSSSTSDVVQLLIDKGAKLDSGSPVHSAVEGGNPGAIATLAKSGAKIDEPLTGDPEELGDIHGLTPIQYSKFLGRTSCTRMLGSLAPSFRH